MNLPDKSSNSAEHAAINPYAPVDAVDDRRQDSSMSELLLSYPGTEPPSLVKLWIRWAVVCTISAAPSFFVAYGTREHAPLAMLLGVICFMAAYVWLDYRTHARQWRRNQFVRRILMFGYGTRIAISIVFPAGLMVDLMSGIVTYSLVGMVVARESETELVKQEITFGTTFLLTIVQGAVLNVLIAAWCLICATLVLLFQFLWRRLRPARAIEPQASSSAP